ncbi:MAG: Smr/MutS family protein [Caulobacteraceae bacterium]
MSLAPEDLRLWAIVAATVKPAKGRHLPTPPAKNRPKATLAEHVAAHVFPPVPLAPKPQVRGAPETIEPGRKRRIVRERDPLAARLDLHGLTHDAARARLISFLIQAREEGYRAALVITGKGKQGDGVLRRFAPEWLASHDLRGVVAGVSEAHRKHGGEGALYVALKSR